MRFGLRRHPNKGKHWVVEKYFSMKNLNYPNDKWVFGCTDTNTLMLKLRHISIKRHNMVPNGYSPDDPSLLNFWLNRTHLGSDSNIVSAGGLKIAKNQRHICPWCFETLYNREPIERHHIIPIKHDKYSNLVWLHLVCHSAVTQGGPEASEKLKAQLDKIKKSKIEKGMWKQFDKNSSMSKLYP